MGVVRVHPEGWVDFYYVRGSGRDPLRTYVAETSRVPLVQSDGVRFSKAFGSASGPMQVRFKGPSAERVLDVAAEGAWWRLTLVRNGEEYRVSTGKVDGVAVAVSGPESALEVVVEGRDIGVVFEETPIWFNVFLRDGSNVAGQDMMRIMKGRPEGSPDQLVRTIVSGMLGVDGSFGGHWRLPRDLADQKRKTGGGPRRQGNDFEGWIRYPDPANTTLRGVTIVPGLIQSPPSQSLWAFLDAWRNPTLNELLIDYRDDQPEIIMREKPFVNFTDGSASPWFDLTTHTLSADEVSSINVRNGANRVNFVFLSQDMVPFQPIEQIALYQPVFNKQSIRDHGLRRLEERVSYFEDDQGYLFDITDWRNLVAAWNVLNHRMWAGSVMIEGFRPEIRVGDRVQFDNASRGAVPGLPNAITFYVESVTHMVEETSGGPRSATNLRITRGYDDDNLVQDLYSEARQWFNDSGQPLLGGEAAVEAARGRGIIL